MLSALRACEEHPTILLQLEDMREDLMRFTYKLYALLGQADVFYLQIPPRNILHSEFEAALKPKHRDDNGQPSVSLSRSQVGRQRQYFLLATAQCPSLTWAELGVDSKSGVGGAVSSSADGCQLC